MTEEEKAQAIREMQVKDIAALPVDVKSALIAEFTADIRKNLGLGDGDILTEVKKIQERDAARERAAIKTKITELASTGDTAIKSDMVREMVIEMVESKEPKTVEEVSTVFAEIVGRESVKKALQGQLQTTMGPNQQTQMQPQASAEGSAPGMKGAWFVLPATKAQ